MEELSKINSQNITSTLGEDVDENSVVDKAGESERHDLEISNQLEIEQRIAGSRRRCKHWHPNNKRCNNYQTTSFCEEHGTGVKGVSMVNPIHSPNRVNLNMAKFAIICMIMSIFIPYISLDITNSGDDELEVTGLEIIETWGEFLGFIMEYYDIIGTESGETGNGGEDMDIPLRVYLLMFGGLMLLLSPIIYTFSAIIGSFYVFTVGKLPKTLGIIHISFFIVMILMLLIGGSIIFSDMPNEPGLPSSMLGFLGIGTWVGGLSSIGFIIDSKYMIDD